MHLEMQSLRTGYADLAEAVLARGHESSPRGLRTVEVLGASFTCADPADSLPVGTGRGVVKGLAAVEALQLVGGFQDPNRLVLAAPHYAKFLDPETGRQRAAYGERTAWQMGTVVDELTKDPDSRRAQVAIWDPVADCRPGLHDYPCTTSLQFLVRDGRLHMQVHMRSNDLWLGVPYDVFMFTQMQLTLANVLELEPGCYRHSAASLHIYEHHLDQADALTAPTGDALPTYGLTGSSWDVARARAAGIHGGAELMAMSAGELWLRMACPQ